MILLELVSGDENPARSSAVDRDAEQHDDAAANAWRHRAVNGKVWTDNQKDDVTRRRFNRRQKRWIDGTTKNHSKPSSDDTLPNDRVRYRPKWRLTNLNTLFVTNVRQKMPPPRSWPHLLTTPKHYSRNPWIPSPPIHYYPVKEP